jgi:hypothetical protein
LAPKADRPAISGVILARLDAKKSLTSLRLSTMMTLRPLH